VPPAEQGKAALDPLRIIAAAADIHVADTHVEQAMKMLVDWKRQWLDKVLPPSLVAG